MLMPAPLLIPFALSAAIVTHWVNSRWIVRGRVSWRGLWILRLAGNDSGTGQPNSFWPNLSALNNEWNSWNTFPNLQEEVSLFVPRCWSQWSFEEKNCWNGEEEKEERSQKESTFHWSARIKIFSWYCHHADDPHCCRDCPFCKASNDGTHTHTHIYSDSVDIRHFLRKLQMIFAAVFFGFVGLSWFITLAENMGRLDFSIFCFVFHLEGSGLQIESEIVYESVDGSLMSRSLKRWLSEK